MNDLHNLLPLHLWPYLTHGITSSLLPHKQNNLGKREKD